MATRLFKGTPVAADASGLRLGGQPIAPEGFSWPTCRSCNGPMQFQFQVPLEAAGRPGRVLLAFQCQNDPGLCDEWDPAAGGNAAFVVDVHGKPLAPPPLPEAAAGSKYPANPLVIEPLAPSSDGADPDRIGTVGGTPEWIQADETPTCSCGHTMDFVAEIDEFAHPMFNFGSGGRAYAFACAACDDKAAFLWQR